MSALVSEMELPSGWKWVKLGKVIKEAQSGFACGERDTNGVIQLRMNNVDTNGNFVWDNFIRVPAGDDLIGKYRLKEGDVLFNNTNSVELVGKTALFIEHKEPVVYSNHFTRIRTREDLAPPFLASWLIYKWKTKTFEKICNRWIGQSAVKNDKLLSIQIPLPPLPEQKRIAAILNEQMSAVEKARAAAEARLEAARALPAAYLREVFESEEAKKWPRKLLGDVCNITARLVDPKYDEFNNLPHVFGNNIESGMCRLTYLNTAKEDGMTSGKYLFESGDVLYSKLRPYLRKTLVADFRGLCSADMYPITVNKDILDPYYTAWMLLSEEFTKYADEQSRRSRMPKLNRDQLFSWKAPIPSLSEQQRLINIMRDKILSVEVLRGKLHEEFEAIKTLPSALLRKAFNGEL